MKRHNIEFLWAWFDLLRRRDRESMAAALDPHIVWQGVRPDLVCHGPEEVVAAFVTAYDANREIDSLELVGGGEARVRLAGRADAEAIGRLLHDFNTEFDDITPGPRALADRIRQLLDGRDTTVILAGAGPDGLAVLRFRPAIWTDAPECYLAELYVVPERRGQGLGRALMEAAIEVARARGAAWMDLGTSEDDVAARALYESLGFSNREGKPDGPINYYYERAL